MSTTSLKSLSEIFNQSLFRIPDYQRGYSWETHQLKDFLDDLTNLDDGKVHYTGMLTLQQIPLVELEKKPALEQDRWLWKNRGYKAYYVVDGQQRLTTASILVFCLLRMYRGDTILFFKKEELIKKYMWEMNGAYPSFLFGYERDNPSDEYFRSTILEHALISSQNNVEQTVYTSNLKAAKSFFMDSLQGWPDENLESLFSKLVNSFKFNVYEIDDQLDVFVTFESMNNRGKQLSRLELLKNRLIYLSTLLPKPNDDLSIDDWNGQLSQLRNEINLAWKTIYVHLGRNASQALDDDDFLYYHWVVYFGFTKDESDPHVKFLLSEYFTAQSVRRKDSPISIPEIRNYVQHLSMSAREWYLLHFPQNADYPNDSKYWLEKLVRLGWGPFRPLLLASLMHWRDTGDSGLTHLCAEIERFVFMVFEITGRRSNTEQARFYRRAHALFVNKSTESLKAIGDEIRRLNSISDEEGEHDGWFNPVQFKDKLEDLYHSRKGYYDWGGLKYLLYEYELHHVENARGGVLPVVRWDDIQLHETVEHIYPQTPEDSYWQHRFSFGTKKSELKRMTMFQNTLGNLLLLSRRKNSSLQNSAFPAKTERYKEGSYSEREVFDGWEHWTKSATYQRGVRMLKFAERRWSFKFESFGLTYKDLLLPDETHLHEEK